MPTELQTIWARRSFRGDADQSALDRVAAMLDDGWELAGWQLVTQPDSSLSEACDVFLLKRFTPSEDQGGDAGD